MIVLKGMRKPAPGTPAAESAEGATATSVEKKEPVAA